MVFECAGVASLALDMTRIARPGRGRCCRGRGIPAFLQLSGMSAVVRPPSDDLVADRLRAVFLFMGCEAQAQNPATEIGICDRIIGDAVEIAGMAQHREQGQLHEGRQPAGLSGFILSHPRLIVEIDPVAADVAGILPDPGQALDHERQTGFLDAVGTTTAFGKRRLQAKGIDAALWQPQYPPDAQNLARRRRRLIEDPDQFVFRQRGIDPARTTGAERAAGGARLSAAVGAQHLADLDMFAEQAVGNSSEGSASSASGNSPGTAPVSRSISRAETAFAGMISTGSRSTRMASLTASPLISGFAWARDGGTIAVVGAIFARLHRGLTERKAVVKKQQRYI